MMAYIFTLDTWERHGWKSIVIGLFIFVVSALGWYLMDVVFAIFTHYRIQRRPRNEINVCVTDEQFDAIQKAVKEITTKPKTTL